MKLSWRRALPLLLLLAISIIIYLAYFSSKPIYRFEGLRGPASEDRVAPAVASDVSAYSGGAESRLALLITDTDSDWLGLAHGLKTIGVPFVTTQRHKEAVKHKVVMVYPTISGKVLDQTALQALASHPRNGGTLIGFEILGGGLNEVFGFTEAVPAKTRKLLKMDEEEAKTFGLAGAEELEIPLSGRAGTMGSYAYDLHNAKALAHYDDGTAAIVRRDFERGRAYAFGIDAGAYIAKAYNGRQDLGRHYVNAYEPAVDVLLRTIRQIYRTSEPLAVTLETVPQGKSAAVVITHDVDYTRSIENATGYAEFERSQQFSATYFIQTKYVQDWNDDIFFNAHGAELTRQLSGMKMEIASHSVSHSYAFSTFPLGTGKETYPDYVPFVQSKLEAKNGTVLGELRVSRFLLESAVPDLKVQSFRPGHLQNPYSLPQAMQATGYRFSSSVTSGIALTHLPFQLNYNRENRTETPVFEFPITIEDELQRPMTARLPQAVEILQKLQRYGGLCVVLIHPDVFDDKLAFLKGFVAQARNSGAWLGSLGEFGNWWAARNQVQVDVKPFNGRYLVETELPQAADGLTLRVPAGWKLEGAEILSGKAEQQGEKLVLTGVAGKAKLVFAAHQ